VSNGGVIVKNELERKWKEGVVTYLRYSSVSLQVRGKPQETSVMIAGLWAEAWSTTHQNTKNECHPVCRFYFIRLYELRERKKMLVNIASCRPEFEPTPSEYRIILVSTISPCSVVLSKKTVLAKNLNDATPLFVRKNSVRKCTKDRQLRIFCAESPFLAAGTSVSSFPSNVSSRTVHKSNNGQKASESIAIELDVWGCL